MRRLRLVLLVIALLLLPQGVFAGTLTLNSGANLDANPKVQHAQNLIKRKMRMYHHYNIQLFGDDVWFFAFHKTDRNIPFGWYRLNTKKRFSRAERFLSSSEFSLLFRAAISPSGKEMVVTSKTGEIFIQNLMNGKKQSLGAYLTGFDYPRYSYPAYTPDGQYLILHDPWENNLLVVDALSMDISQGTKVPGFWLTEGGGETPEPEIDLSVYQFSDDGTKVTFGNHTLDLLTLAKE